MNNFQDYDCGHRLLLTISSDYYNCCKEFNEVADELSELDPNCPKHRYKLEF